jgi:hypothetical protein
MQVYYLLRSKADGSYVSANPDPDAATKYLLLFQQDFEALSYLNAHGQDVANKFAVESMASTQLKGILQRWGFHGIGVIQDPLLPRIEFLAVN